MAAGINRVGYAIVGTDKKTEEEKLLTEFTMDLDNLFDRLPLIQKLHHEQYSNIGVFEFAPEKTLSARDLHRLRCPRNVCIDMCAFTLSFSDENGKEYWRQVMKQCDGKCDYMRSYDLKNTSRNFDVRIDKVTGLAHVIPLKRRNPFIKLNKK